MRLTFALAYIASVTAATYCTAQDFDAASFFAPPIRAQHAQTSQTLLFDAGVVTNEQASGNIRWEVGAGGYAGATVGTLLGVHLGAYTETTGTSLVFGRSLELEGLGGLLEDQLATVLNASVLPTWTATSEVSGLDLVANQLYQVTFDVSTGPGLPASVLDSATFGISSAGVTSFGGDSQGLVNLLGVVAVGDTPWTGQVSLLFSSSTDRSSLNFAFDAASLANLGALGGVEGNQNVLTFSNIQVQAVPEPSQFALVVAAAGLLMRRKRRN